MMTKANIGSQQKLTSYRKAMLLPLKMAKRSDSTLKKLFWKGVTLALEQRRGIQVSAHTSAIGWTRRT